MKKLKRMIAVLMTVIMTMAMTLPAFAASGQGQLTVKVNGNNTLKGQTISIYKLFDVTVSNDGQAYGYKVNDKYKETLINVLKLGPTASSDEIYEAVSQKSGIIQDFANDFTKELLTKAPKIVADKSEKISTEKAEHTFSNVDYGYYLVYQTGTTKLQSSLVTVSKSGVTTVELKGEAPSIEKEADKETVEIGQVVKYTVTGTIPDTTGYESYVYKIKDTLSNGLDFSSKEGAKPINTSYDVSVKIGNGQDSTMTATLDGENKRTMILDLSQWIRDNQNKKGQSFTITYYAKVNQDAVVKTNNSASLIYGNEPGNITETTPVTKKTPTYPLNIKKTESKNNSLLAGATFRIYRSEEAAKKAGDDAIKVSSVGPNSGKYVLDETQGNMDMVSVDAAITEGVNLHLNGLAAGDYWIVETKAPDGYNKITTPIKVTITKTGDETWTIDKNGTNEPDKIINVVNSTGSILPGTGGIGTILFTLVGISLIVIVAGSFINSRRKNIE